MNKTCQLLLEIGWIVLGTLSLAIGIREIISGWNDRSYMYFILAAVSFAFAWYRHRQRGKN